MTSLDYNLLVEFYSPSNNGKPELKLARQQIFEIAPPHFNLPIDESEKARGEITNIVIGTGSRHYDVTNAYYFNLSKLFPGLRFWKSPEYLTVGFGSGGNSIQMIPTADRTLLEKLGDHTNLLLFDKEPLTATYTIYPTTTALKPVIKVSVRKK